MRNSTTHLQYAENILPTTVSEDLLRKVIFWGGDGARKILGRERQDMRASEMRFFAARRTFEKCKNGRGQSRRRMTSAAVHGQHKASNLSLFLCFTCGEARVSIGDAQIFDAFGGGCSEMFPCWTGSHFCGWWSLEVIQSSSICGMDCRRSIVWVSHLLVKTPHIDWIAITHTLTPRHVQF